MAQVGWVYLDDFGSQHRIGVYHGDRTGHLLIHCNLRVLQVDFSVKESRTYSFFVEDELCEVSIIKEKNGYSYDFQVNKKIDTPRNRLRKSSERRNRWQIALFFGGVLLFVGLLFVGFNWYGRSHRSTTSASQSLTSGLTPDNERRLLLEGKSAIAQLLLVEEPAGRKVYYGFSAASGKQISGLFTVPDSGPVLLPNGFPLADRDAFSVRYVPDDPRVHRIDFTLPTDQTLAGYLQQALEAEHRAHPAQSEAHSRCVAQLTLAHKGWAQLADLIFQSTSPEENPGHNRETYLRLVREPAFAQTLEQECWNK